MENRQASSPVPVASCQTRDLTCGGMGLFFWCLPIAAVILGFSWASARPWLWIPAFLLMGIACLVNAARCGRLHCYFTGPLFLLAAVYVVLAEFSLVPMRPGIFLDVVLLMTVLAFLAELPFGRYRKRA
jgi:hypothetical protein